MIISASSIVITPWNLLGICLMDSGREFGGGATVDSQTVTYCKSASRPSRAARKPPSTP